MNSQHQRIDAGSPVLHLRCPAGVTEDAFRNVLELVADVTPVVQPLPPSAMVANVAGALRFFDRSPVELGLVIRTRALSLHGLPVAIGVGPNWSIAAMASREPGPSSICAVGCSRAEVEAFLYPRPVGDLYGIGKQQAHTLINFGIHTIGLLATLPEGTVQRVLGGQAGRLLRERARGIDRRAIEPTDLPRSAVVRRRFSIDTLLPDVQRAALLACVVDLGERLRTRRQAAKALSVTVTFHDRTELTRSRLLTSGPSAHTDDLRALAYELHASMGLQRARVRGIAVRGEQLLSADQVAEQLSLDELREDRLRTEPVIDRLNRRFGTGTVGPAASYRRAG